MAAAPSAKDFLHEGDHVGVGLELIAFGILVDGVFLPVTEIGEVIVGSGGVEQLLGETALGGSRLHVVLVFGEILGHVDELAADVVPAVEHDFGRTVGRFDGSVFLHGVLRVGGQGWSSGKNGCGYEGNFHH